MPFHPDEIQYMKGERVSISNTDPTDHIRGVRDGAVGTIVKVERRDNQVKGKVKPVICCPLVQIEGGELMWMGMHQLNKEE